MGVSLLLDTRCGNPCIRVGLTPIALWTNLGLGGPGTWGRPSSVLGGKAQGSGSWPNSGWAWKFSLWRGSGALCLGLWRLAYCCGFPGTQGSRNPICAGVSMVLKSARLRARWHQVHWDNVGARERASVLAYLFSTEKALSLHRSLWAGGG